MRKLLPVLLVILLGASVVYAAEIRILGNRDLSWGSGTWVSTGGATVYRINADIVPFSQDNDVKVGSTYYFALVATTGSAGQCLQADGDNTFSWGACGAATTTLPWDNITSRPTINGVTVTGAVLDNASNYPTFNQSTTGNAATATALAANGGNCSAGQAPIGVDAGGAVESCWTPGDMLAATYDANTDNVVDSAIATAVQDNLIVNADINSSAAIDATKIADGTVTSAEFQYLGDVTSAIQAQFTAKAPLISPSFTTPTLGVATATSINKVALTAPATGSTLTIAEGKTLTASNTLTFTGTDGSTLAIGTGGTLGTGAYATIANYAPLASPTFTGTVTIPTPFTLGATSVTATGIELNYLAGASSGIQDQLDGKSPIAGSSSIVTVGTITTGTWNASAVPITSGGTGATSSAAARTNLGLGTDDNVVFGSITTDEWITSCIASDNACGIGLGNQSDPTGQYLDAAYLWFNTTSNMMKVRNGDNSATLEVMTSGASHAGTFATTGLLNGGMRSITKSGNYTVGTDNAYEAYGAMIYVTGAATITAPPVADGMHFCVHTIGAIAVSVDVNASDGIRLNGGTRDTDGDSITNSSTAGDQICLNADSADGWTTHGRSGTWTAN